MKRVALILILLLPLAACGASGGGGLSIESGSDACGPDRWRSLLGKPEVAARRARLPAGARIIRPGDAVKADYMAERLNVDIGRDGIVEALRCG